MIAVWSFVPTYVVELSGRGNAMTDFFQDWASARNVLEGLPVYSNHRVTIPRYLGKTDLNESDLFVEINAHPPTSILLVLPLGALPYRVALMTWNYLSLGMFAASLILVWRGLRIPFSSRSALPAITLLLTCFPLTSHIHFGQLTMVIVLLLTGAWACDRADREILAGVLLGAAVTIKVFPAVVFLYFVVRGRWKTVAAGLISIALITLLTGLAIGFPCFSYYVNEVLPGVAKYRGLWFNLSLPGYWTKLFDPPSEYHYIEPLAHNPLLARAATFLSCVPVLAVLAWVARRARTRDESDLAFGLTLTATLLVSPIAWDHYLLVMLLPLATIWLHLPRSPGPRILFVGIVMAFWSLPYAVYDLTIPGGITGIAKPLHTMTIGSYQCYALLALFVLGIVELRKLETIPLSLYHSQETSELTWQI
jgi:Glycosyltransferase family 87